MENMSTELEDLVKLNLYDLLQVSCTAGNKEIQSAYRKKALSCHPDKNPDNPEAVKLFQQLSKALEILTDGPARTAYDKVLKAKKAHELRNAELDSKRRKLKKDLETREKAAREEEFGSVDPAKTLQEEIERLRKEGSKLLEEEQELLRKHMQKKEAVFSEEEKRKRLKIKWKAEKADPLNGGYTYEFLHKVFNKQLAYENESGLSSNPIQLSWIPSNQGSNERFQQESYVSPKDSETVKAEGVLTSKDYESIVLMKLRQSEERKQIIEEMMKNQDTI
ncbi:dnaJ homolog subfamily C member 17-like isoform X2 [Limulus polyphemus]|uniref:DnaJ homolog subfamily C member 17-like isoform X2 n=1 Tax=Limulus polyphemus TaxID=6850 RepID=A0ABM1B4A7_LIMPO|nr:dnaJ homolog subfamily C member 17-like isoform X2 [Limulus polyphemus]